MAKGDSQYGAKKVSGFKKKVVTSFWDQKAKNLGSKHEGAADTLAILS